MTTKQRFVLVPIKEPAVQKYRATSETADIFFFATNDESAKDHVRTKFPGATFTDGDVKPGSDANNRKAFKRALQAAFAFHFDDLTTAEMRTVADIFSAAIVRGPQPAVEGQVIQFDDKRGQP